MANASSTANPALAHARAAHCGRRPSPERSRSARAASRWSIRSSRSLPSAAVPLRDRLSPRRAAPPRREVRRAPAGSRLSPEMASGPVIEDLEGRSAGTRKHETGFRSRGPPRSRRSLPMNNLGGPYNEAAGASDLCRDRYGWRSLWRGPMVPCREGCSSRRSDTPQRPRTTRAPERRHTDRPRNVARMRGVASELHVLLCSTWSVSASESCVSTPAAISQGLPEERLWR